MMSFYEYNYGFLMQDHLTLTAYLLLIFTFLIIYAFKNFYVRGVFFSLSLIFALYSGHVTWLGLLVILALGGVFYYAFEGKKEWGRGGATLAILAFSLVILFIKAVPGIENWNVASNILLSPKALPYSMWLTFDKSLLGLFFVWFSTYSLANEGKWKPTLKKGFWAGIFAVGVLIPLSYLLGYVTWDPKWTNFIFLFAVHNLFFVCIAEEALFRGVIQKCLMTGLQRFSFGNAGALVLSALIFGAAHFSGGLTYMGLATVAGLFYGYAFLKTKKIEAAILAHFMVNMVHFVFFTYPAINQTL